jgi:hypothetical protein
MVPSVVSRVTFVRISGNSNGLGITDRVSVLHEELVVKVTKDGQLTKYRYLVMTSSIDRGGSKSLQLCASGTWRFGA